VGVNNEIRIASKARIAKAEAELKRWQRSSARKLTAKARPVRWAAVCTAQSPQVFTYQIEAGGQLRGERKEDNPPRKPSRRVVFVAHQ